MQRCLGAYPLHIVTMVTFFVFGFFSSSSSTMASESSSSSLTTSSSYVEEGGGEGGEKGEGYVEEEGREICRGGLSHYRSTKRTYRFLFFLFFNGLFHCLRLLGGSLTDKLTHGPTTTTHACGLITTTNQD